jgi:ATP-dependent Clp protease adaptor protein ClpS
MSQSHADRPSIPPGDDSPPKFQRVPETAAARRQVPRYRVVLLQNADSDLMHVVRTVMELMRFCRAEATHKMWEAHHNGRSVLLLTWFERAELYAEQFAQRGLHVVVEPALT